MGADMLEADHRLKRMALGLMPIGVPGISSMLERWSERNRTRYTAQSDQIDVRHWFEPVQDRVIVRDDVVQLGPMTVSVFTEVLSASVGGKTVDPSTYHDEDSDAFARAITIRFNDLARVHPTIARLRGLNGIVAVVAGLEHIDRRPSLEYWLRDYSVRVINTPPTVEVLQQVSQQLPITDSGLTRHHVRGGVELRAIAEALQSGDVSALRRAVLVTRPGPMSVSWRM
jgi:hypothetical protein